MKKVYSASVTPLQEDGSLDLPGLKNLVDRGVRHGLDGLFLLGSMGEWGSFDSDFKEALVKEAAAAVNRRMELLVGINATSLNLSLEQVRRYAKYDFDSYVFMLPGRTSSLDPVKSILKVLDAADRGVYYYHCPPNNHIALSLKDFEVILSHPNLKGIKNSASDMWLRKELLWMRREKGFSARFLEGQEWAVDEALIIGCDGMLCGMGALASKVMVRLARAVDHGDYAEAVRLQSVLLGIFHGVYGVDVVNIWNGQKYALSRLGIISSSFTLAQEMSLLTEEAKRRIEHCLEQYREELDG